MSEEQEDLKSLLVPFSYPISIGESDKTTVRNLRVSLGKMSIKEDKGLYSVTQNVSMNFLMKIPKEILDYLEG